MLRARPCPVLYPLVQINYAFEWALTLSLMAVGLRHAPCTGRHAPAFVVNVGNVVMRFSSRSHVNLYCIYTQYINFKTYIRIDDYIDYKPAFPL